MDIHPVKHVKGDTNRFCGPSAISILTGMNTGEAARLIRHTTGKKLVTGTHDSQIDKSLRRCNLYLDMVADYRWSKPKERPTLTQWLKQCAKLRKAGRVFLIAAGNHWQIITGRRYCCGLSGQIVGLTHEKVRRRARMEVVYEVRMCVGKSKIVIPDEARKPEPKTQTDPYLRELRALEKKHGFKGKVERESGYTDYMIPACEQFPEGLGTCHYDWAETLSRIEAAIEEPELIEDGWISF